MAASTKVIGLKGANTGKVNISLLTGNSRWEFGIKAREVSGLHEVVIAQFELNVTQPLL